MTATSENYEQDTLLDRIDAEALLNRLPPAVAALARRFMAGETYKEMGLPRDKGRRFVWELRTLLGVEVRCNACALVKPATDFNWWTPNRCRECSGSLQRGRQGRRATGARRANFTSEERAEIQRLYQVGTSRRELAERFGAARRTIDMLLQRGA